MEPLLHPVPDACRRLGIGRSLFYELVRDGRITIVKIGRRAVVPDLELQRFTSQLYAEARAAPKVAA